MVFLLLLIIGVVSALLGSLVGLGGGLIFVPALLFLSNFLDTFSWVTPQTVVAMSLLIMIFTGLSSTLTYLKGKRVDVKSGLIFLIGSVPGALVGVWLNQYFKIEMFELYFGILMLVLSGLLIVKNKVINKTLANQNQAKRFHVKRTMSLNDETISYSYSVIFGVGLAFIVGMLSGLFGIGGGSLMVTSMILFFGFPVHIAAPTSMFMIFVSSIVSSSAHIVAGNVIWLYAIASIPGAWIGGVLGAKLNQRLESNMIEWVLRIMMIIIGIRLIF
ncbi:sulfite exporter TauE/SafE family protein [Bacillaceae bacterium W0354]